MKPNKHLKRFNIRVISTPKGSHPWEVIVWDMNKGGEEIMRVTPEENVILENNRKAMLSVYPLKTYLALLKYLDKLLEVRAQYDNE